MRTIFYMLTFLLFSMDTLADDTISADKIYFFTYDGCPYCKMADDYITLNMPDVKIEK